MVRSAALLVGAVLLAPPLLTAQPLSVEVAIAPSSTIHAGNPLTIHVTATNNGAQTANDVRVHVMFPVFLQFLGVSAPAEWNARYQEVIHGQHQLFAGLSTLPPGGSVTITVEARAPETLWPGSTAPIRGSTAMPGTSLVEQRTDVTIFGAAPIPATASGLSPVGPGTALPDFNIQDAAYDPVHDLYLVSGSLGTFENRRVFLQAVRPGEGPLEPRLELPDVEFPPSVIFAGPVLDSGPRFLIVWRSHETLYSRTVESPSLALGSTTIVADGVAELGPLAYSSTSGVFLVGSRGFVQILDHAGRPVGSRIPVAGMRFSSTIAWNPVTDEFGILASGFTRVGSDGTIRGALDGFVGSHVAVNTSTGHYVVISAGPGTLAAEISPAGRIVSRGAIATDFGRPLPHGLVFNPASGTFVALLEGGPRLVELNGHGAPLSEPIDAPCQDFFVSRRSLHARPGAAQWRVLNSTCSAIATSTGSGGSTVRLGGCSAPDPFAAAGGGHCFGGHWLPPTTAFAGMPQACSYALTPGSIEAGGSAATLSVTLSTSVVCPWTATSASGFLGVAPFSGTGPATLQVSVAPNASALPRTGAVTVAGQDLVVSQHADGEPPFGFLDTPAAGATVAGAIAVTGWALDNAGVAGVRIYRACVPFDASPPCHVIAPGGIPRAVVFLGDAVFVPGARPDVASAFPTAPGNTRAGWGLMVLTNMLPDVPNGTPSGGQGPFTLLAVAVDHAGLQTLLGERTLTVDNAGATSPFGTIDTPGQGQTVSGTLANFGWALTPGTARIPIDGSTIVVFVDGEPIGTIAYNLCRGTVGSPAPAGTCNDDVAALFPEFTNIRLEGGAIGVTLIDTSSLTDGLHTIAWSVTDDLGRVAGIGSRFFHVQNGGAPANTAAVRAAAPAAAASPEPGVRGRTGFDLRARWETIEPDRAGIRHLRIPELGRLELRLGAGVTHGALLGGAGELPLPAGSRLGEGTFTWAPAAGQLGEYQLMFGGPVGHIRVHVTIAPAPRTGHAIQAYIDLPQPSLPVAGGFTVAGWAFDAGAWQGAGIGAIHVWAIPRGAGAPVFLGPASIGGERRDVAAVYGWQFARSGWTLTAPALPPGDYDVVAYFWSTRTGRFEDARSVLMIVR